MDLETILLYAFNSKLLRQTVELTTLILTFYEPKAIEQYGNLVAEFFLKVTNLVDSRGIAFTVRYVKSTRLAVTRYLSGHPLDSLDQVALVKGWPAWLLPHLELLETTSGKRILMTLLVSLRFIHLDAVLDVQPIVGEWKGSDSITEREFNHASRQLGIYPRVAS